MDLFTLSREHDLPPKWNGCVVRWTSWHDSPLFFICPPPKERDVCPRCGSVDTPVMNDGIVALKRSTTLEQLDGAEKFGRLGDYALYRLTAFRCVNCQHDQVWDRDCEEWWDLDDSDYGDKGSVDPNGRWQR